MQKKFLLLLVLLLYTIMGGYAQKMSIGGNVQDTSAKTPLPYAVVMAIRLNDSILLAHTHSDEKGFFKLSLPIDTVQVIISHPKYSEQSFFVLGSSANHEFDFGKIVLPSKSHTLQEIVIYAYKDPVYYKGDTLEYTADSFKVKPNATVEDLLKKLPGIKVDAEGKISAQGKKVDQVLVDGDEFFGSDPTVATQNLSAKSVESVQVYEKKNDQATDSDNETIQVMNLKLKEEAKKGYFGKLSAASDGNKFYEGEALANKFSGKQKISFFALGSNTPRSNIGWGDMYKYGLNNEMPTWTGSEEEGYSSGSTNQNIGIPQTLKTGIYYTDKITPKTKVTSNYTYNRNQLITNSATTSQYFLTDTSYTTSNLSSSKQVNETHNVNFNLEQKIDSLTTLYVIPKLTMNSGKSLSEDNTDFNNSEGTLSRTTKINNSNVSSGYDLNTTAIINRRFKKKDRLLDLTYNNVLTKNSSTGYLSSINAYYNSLTPNDTIDQKKVNTLNSTQHNVTARFLEPINKKVSLEFTYNLNYALGLQNKQTFDYFNGEYSVNDSIYTNNFENRRMTNRLGLKFIYELKKHRVSVGAKVRQVDMRNTNLITNLYLLEKVNNILPFAIYRFRISDSRRFGIGYTTNSDIPTTDQLQPVSNNTNPNQVKRGNPNLLPSFKQKGSMTYSSYKAISGNYIFVSVDYTSTSNAFSNAITYDSIGRTITTPINVNGNYDANSDIEGGYSLFSKVLTISPSFNLGYNSYTNYINDIKNTTTTFNTSSSLGLDLRLDTLEFDVSYKYDYYSPSSTINSANNKPYATQRITGDLTLRLPFKMVLETDATYNINSKRAAGYNINYLVWNASIKKTLLKNENLIVSFDAMDILKQNINVSAMPQNNVLTYSKTNIITRYFLLKLVYKFNSNKVKEKEDDDFY